MNIDDRIKQKIIKYERMLQNPSDNDLAILSELLDNDFYEIGQSGRVWNKTQICSYFSNLQSENEDVSEIVMTDEHFKIISQEILLLTYKIKKIDLTIRNTICSLRSSLWRKANNSWAMVFHQGTPMIGVKYD